MTTDARVDAYIAKSAAFAQPLLAHLRAQVHAACPEAQETIKWSSPHWLLDGKILARMAAFKAHCAFGFWFAEAAEENKNADAMGQFGRITTLADLPAPRDLQTQIRTAARLIRAGAKNSRGERTPRPALSAPEDLLAALAGNPAARASFEGFPPGKQRDYVEWITEAKRPETRSKRLAQSIEWLAEGKARHWKYERC